MAAHYVMDHKGLNRYARESADLQRLIRARAERGVHIAKALAPVGVDSPNPGEFRDSIRAVDHPVRDEYGYIFGVRIVADSRDAVWAEFGRTRTNVYEGSHALGRTARYLKVPKRGI